MARKHDKIFNVVANLKEPLLGKQAIEALKLILTCPTTASKQKLLKGLGEFKGEFQIKLKHNNPIRLLLL